MQVSYLYYLQLIKRGNPNFGANMEIFSLQAIATLYKTRYDRYFTDAGGAEVPLRVN